jgi:hypothetical protein
LASIEACSVEEEDSGSGSMGWRGGAGAAAAAGGVQMLEVGAAVAAAEQSV